MSAIAPIGSRELIEIYADAITELTIENDRLSQRDDTRKRHQAQREFYAYLFGVSLTALVLVGAYLLATYRIAGWFA